MSSQLIYKMCGLKIEEAYHLQFINAISSPIYAEGVLCIKHVDIDMIEISKRKLAECKARQKQNQFDIEDYINKTLDIEFTQQCLDYGWGKDFGWEEILEVIHQEQQLSMDNAKQEQYDLEHQTGIFDFPPSNGPEDEYIGCFHDNIISDPY